MASEIVDEHTHRLLDIKKDIMNLHSDIERYDWHQCQNNQSSDALKTDSRYTLRTTDREAIYDVSNLSLELEFVCLTTEDGPLTQSNYAVCPSSAFHVFDSIRLLFDDVEVAQVLKPGKADIIRSAFQGSLVQSRSVGYNEGLWLDDNGNIGATGNISIQSIDADSTVVVTNPLLPFKYRSVMGVVTDATGPDVNAISPNEHYNAGWVERYKRCVGGQSVNCMLPLKRVFPILESMRALRGVKIEVQMVRNTVMGEVMYTSGDSFFSKLEIRRLDMWVPRIQPTLTALARFEAALQSNEVVKLHYHHMEFHRRQGILPTQSSDTFTVSTELQRPAFALVCFNYTVRDSLGPLNSLLFDGSPIKTLRMFINNTQCPEVEYDTSSAAGTRLRLSRIIMDCHQLSGKKASFDTDSSSVLDYDRWRYAYPIFPFDLSKIPMSSLSGKSPAEVKIQWTCGSWGTGDNSKYDVNCLLFSERALDLHLRSGKMVVRRS
jgi:hypothetical protein